MVPWHSVKNAAWLGVAVLTIITAALPPRDLRADHRASAERGSRKETSGATSDAGTKVVRGRVVDQAGIPVGGARLWLPLQYQPRRVVDGTTDTAGRFELEFPSDWISTRSRGSSWTIWAYAPGLGIATQSPHQAIRGDSNDEIEIKLTPPSNTRFRILTPAGQPVAGALVQPQNYRTSVGYDLVPQEMLSYVSARTDADGVAKLSALRLKPLFRVQIVSEEFGTQAIRVDRDVEQPVRDIRLREPARIEGRIVGDRAEWLRGVRLAFTVDNQDEWTQTSGEAEAVTDEDGRFEVPTIASGGPLHTYIRLDPSLPVRPRLNDKLFLTAGETLNIDIPLVPAPRVFGKVKAQASGKPIANAEISLRYGGYRQGDDAMTDEQGQFEGRALPGPMYAQLIVLPEGYVQLGAPWAEPFEVPSSVDEFEIPTIEVVATHKLSGRLIDEKDQPLKAMQLMAVRGNRRYGFATTDADGRFAMNVPDGVENTIEVYTDQRGQEPVTVVEQDPLVVRYTGDGREKALEAERALKPDVTLTGQARLGGQPLAGVRLTLNRGVPVELAVPPGGKAPARKATGMRIQKVTSTLTDAQGRYRLSGIKAGESYQIEVKPAFAASDPAWHYQLPWMPKLPNDAEEEVALPDINLRRLTQSLAGRVVDPDGNPVEGAHVSAMLRDGHTTLARNSMAGTPPWTETDKDGRFKLQDLPDEPLAIMAYIRPKGGGAIRSPAKLNVELNQQDIRIMLDPSLAEEAK